jgi:hypothetical protein
MHILHSQAHPGYVPTLAAAYTYAMGAAATAPTMYNYAIAILPVSRTSSLLSSIGLSYEVRLCMLMLYCSIIVPYKCYNRKTVLTTVQQWKAGSVRIAQSEAVNAHCECLQNTNAIYY